MKVFKREARAHKSKNLGLQRQNFRSFFLNIINNLRSTILVKYML